MHVLIADDHALFRKALTMLVGKIDDGATCEGVGSVEELKQVCVNRQFDVVLLDIGLPDFDWPEQIDEIKQSVGACRLVIVSGSENVSDMRSALRAGASGYLPKAEPEEVTLKALDLVFAGGSYFPTIVYQEREETGEDSHQRTGGGTEGVNLPALTQRQRQILDLLAQGHSNKEIAYRLNMREATIRVHMSNLFKRLGVTSRTQAALLARGHGSSP